MRVYHLSMPILVNLHVWLVLIVVTWMKPVYFLSSSCTCWSAFALMVLSLSVPILIKYGTMCNSPTHHPQSSQHAFFHMQSASYITLITFMYSSTYLSLYLWTTPVLQIQHTTHDYLPALSACSVIGWGWLHNEGDYLPVQDARGPVVGWGWWHWVQSSSLVSDDGRKTQVSVWCTPVWLCWPYCKRNTQLIFVTVEVKHHIEDLVSNGHLD